MKIFGTKRPSSVEKPIDQETSRVTADIPIPSYFSSEGASKTKTPSSNPATNVQEILSKDPNTLTSKERRLVRRFQERYGGGTGREIEQGAVTENTSTSNLSVKVDAVVEVNDDFKLDSSDITQQFQGLNSKERRSLLRTLKKTHAGNSAALDHLLSIATEEAKRVGQENFKKDQLKVNTDTKDELQPNLSERQPKKRRKIESCQGATTVENCISQKERVMENKRNAIKDWSHLAPEERHRREQQRQKQIEAAERRKALMGSDEGKTCHRHPLNSERRRANRRKPSGKAARLLLKTKVK